ncbi:hypothetical protein CFAM422_000765 [Trichoderma lentiforme]|uniref:Uncharacterized protein n=1 Tax=Trichoderma lentiforme TaxID=1567552 RepID=A0A9P5CGW9_9HYPO|nr:hypothetical protein CFAM422_000765 [Trichoderma lentiforme]
MSPTYTMSAHLCRQFYTSWHQSRRQNTPSSATPSTTTSSSAVPTIALPSRSPSPEKIIVERRGSTSSDSSLSSSPSSR